MVLIQYHLYIMATYSIEFNILVVDGCATLHVTVTIIPKNKLKTKQSEPRNIYYSDHYGVRGHALRHHLTNIPSGQSSAKLPVNRSLGHSVTWSLGHSVTRSLGSLGQSLFSTLRLTDGRTDGHTTSGSTGLLRRQKCCNTLSYVL